MRAPAIALAVLAALVLATPSPAAGLTARDAGTNVSPSGPPLAGGGSDTGAGVGSEATGASTAEAQVDPLVGNGLGSPICKGQLAGELPAPSRHNCETAGFEAAPAPTGDYGFDVHIDTGLLSLGTGTIDSAIQGIVVAPVWMALVWAVHALLVMLEWCFTLNLLGSGATIGLGSGLREMQATFTQPWLAIVLACAAMIAAYRGLVRRRVADALGETLMMGAMMVAGLAVIADPTGTVGSLGQWAGQASLGTLSVAASGTPQRPGRALADSLGALFVAAVEAPWCYLEFGQVSWCREPSRLDPRLHAAALGIAARDAAALACRPELRELEAGESVACVQAASAQGRALQQTIELLRDARSNGAIFLALPANGAARNSIEESGSLLRALCQGSEASNCHGPTAAQAEFRTDGGTWARLGGLVLIAGGLAGMLALLGFLAVRLLIAAVFTLLYLLLAPAIVLTPAFGEPGRTAFRRWGSQLLGAVVSKLVLSFLLGVVLGVLGILYKLSALGWWTQWLLTSAFWWSAFRRRHQVLGQATAPGSAHQTPCSLARRMGEVLDTPRRGVAAARWAKHRLAKEGSSERGRERAQVGREIAEASAGQQVTRTLETERRDAQARIALAPQTQHRLAGQRARLKKLEAERSGALARGDTRRAASLSARVARVQAEIEHEQAGLEAARTVVREGEHAQRRSGVPYTQEQRDVRERFLTTQAALPSRGRPGPAGERRDYVALASLAGYGREEYERLDPRRQRSARAEIDRELALRGELGRAVDALADASDAARLGGRERRKASRDFDGAVRQRLRARGHAMPASREPRSGADRRHESSVMRDAREVAARRKRQLGQDRQ